MKAFLTGGTGFIGTHLIDLLLARDTEVYVLVRNPDKEPALLKKEVRVLRGTFSLSLRFRPASTSCSTLPAEYDL